MQAGLGPRAFRNLCQVIVWHEESFHSRVHIEPHMLPEGICEGQQQSSLWFTASKSQTTEFTPCQLELTPGSCLPWHNALLWQSSHVLIAASQCLPGYHDSELLLAQSPHLSYLPTVLSHNAPDNWTERQMGKQIDRQTDRH